MKKKSEQNFGRQVGCAALFLTPFFITGCVMAVLTVKHFVRSAQIGGWEQTEATVKRAHAKEVSDGDSSEWVITAAYRYRHEGHWYDGRAVGISDKAPFGRQLRKRAAELKAAARSREPVPCFVNPEDPAEARLYPGAEWPKVIMFAIVCFIFGGVGLGGYVLLWFMHRDEKFIEGMKALYPDEPWRWKKEWQHGVITAGAKAKMIGVWVFAAIWNGISSPILFVFGEEWASGNRGILVGLLFPIVGVGLLVAAIRATLQWRKYGRAQFIMKSVPGVIGGSLLGAIRVPRPLELEGDLKLTLTNIKSVTRGSGKNSRTEELPLWQRETLVAPEQIRLGQQSLVPAVFSIPYSCRSTDEDADISWRLEAAAPTAGLDLDIQFDVPVYKTDASDPAITEETVGETAVAEEAVEAAAGASRVRLRRSGGAVELAVPPAVIRAPLMVLGFVVFTLIWTGICVFLLRVDAPLLFPIVFGLVNLGLWFGLACYLTGSCVTRVTRESVSVAARFLFFTRRREIPAASVLRVDYEVTGRAQSGSKTYPYYSVRLFYRGDGGAERKLDLATTVGNRAEAAWIAREVELAILEEDKGSFAST